MLAGQARIELLKWKKPHLFGGNPPDSYFLLTDSRSKISAWFASNVTARCYVGRVTVRKQATKGRHAVYILHASHDRDTAAQFGCCRLDRKCRRGRLFFRSGFHHI